MAEPRKILTLNAISARGLARLPEQAAALPVVIDLVAGWSRKVPHGALHTRELTMKRLIH